MIFDNNSHESTGSQPTNSKKINIDKIAKSSNYQVFTVSNEKNLEKILKKIKLINGPIFLKIKITAKQKIGMRINIMPIEIKNKFVKSLIKNYALTTFLIYRNIFNIKYLAKLVYVYK